MQRDEVGRLVSAQRLRDRWPEYFLVLREGDRVLARALSVPFSLESRGREQLPPTGWDGAVVWAVEDALDARQPTSLCALEINVDPSVRGQGISLDAVRAMRHNAARLGLCELVAPVRPPDKAAEPWVPMAE